MDSVERTHDDCDGDFTQQLSLLIGDDGDMYVSTNGVKYLRFRMPVIGGGMSEHTYDALRALFDAMVADNLERPMGVTVDRMSTPQGE